MSELSKAIIARQTREKRYNTDFSKLFKELVSVQDEIQQLDTDILYNIEAVFRVKCWISEQELLQSNSDDIISLHMTEAKEQIIEAVFGEFRQYFNLIKIYIRDREYKKAQDTLTEFYNRMYSK